MRGKGVKTIPKNCVKLAPSIAVTPKLAVQHYTVAE
jgi:hypothetical protein